MYFLRHLEQVSKHDAQDATTVTAVVIAVIVVRFTVIVAATRGVPLVLSVSCTAKVVAARIVVEI